MSKEKFNSSALNNTVIHQISKWINRKAIFKERLIKENIKGEFQSMAKQAYKMTGILIMETKFELMKTKI